MVEDDESNPNLAENPPPPPPKSLRLDSTTMPFDAPGRIPYTQRSAPNSQRNAPNGRVEANTALIKIGQISPEVSAFEPDPMVDGQSGMAPSDGEDEDGDEGGEATSARIAQEYRRQVRIKRLAEEIQQAERAKKKEDELRRKTETALRKSAPSKKKEETAKLDMDQTLPPSPDSEERLAKKREVAMSAFKTASTGRKSRAGLIMALFCLAIIGALLGGGWLFLDDLAKKRAQATKDEASLHALSIVNAKQKAEQELLVMQEHEAELTRQKLAAEDAARKAESEKLALEERMRLQDIERQKVNNEQTAKRVAEARRLREENEKVLEQANREKEELRRKIDDAQRATREKLKREQDEEVARAEQAAAGKTTVAARTVEAAPRDIARTESALPDATKSINTTATRPDANGAVPSKADTLTGDVKTIPSEPAVIPDKLELPSGGVRLFVKASDPYGGKLSFTWHQVKGTQVDIADPLAAKFVDGKWISQTYFVAREPGTYEFEVTVKNDDGVESKKKFPIEVLPPTTLK